MAKFESDGIDEYVKQLEKLEKGAGYIKVAVYEGAAIVADEIRKNLEPHKRTGDLINSLYLSKMQDENGYIYTKVGFAGNDRNGVSNTLKANILESGTSRIKKTSFMTRAIRSAKERAIKAMEKSLDESIEKIMED